MTNTYLFLGKSQYTFKASLLGRSPLCIAKDKLCFLSRCGRIINIHDFNLEKQFPEVAQIEVIYLKMLAFKSCLNYIPNHHPTLNLIPNIFLNLESNTE